MVDIRICDCWTHFIFLIVATMYLFHIFCVISSFLLLLLLLLVLLLLLLLLLSLMICIVIITSTLIIIITISISVIITLLFSYLYLFVISSTIATDRHQPMMFSCQEEYQAWLTEEERRRQMQDMCRCVQGKPWGMKHGWLGNPL